MTTSRHAPTQWQPPAGHRMIPLTRLVRIELRKMVDTRSGMWLLILIAAVSVAAVVMFALFAKENNSFTTYAGAMLSPQVVLLPVLGILLVTSEWGQRTSLVTFTLEPRRELVVVSKILAAAILGLLTLVFDLLVATAATALTDSPATDLWNLTALDVGHATLLQLLAILQGVAFGLLLMNSAAALVLYFLLPAVFPMVFTLMESVREAAPWVDPTTAQTPLGGGEALTGDQWAQLATASFIWIGVPMLAGFIRLKRTEIKTA